MYSAIFSKENLAEALRIWDRSTITIVDIRHKLISSREAIKDYRVPSGMFLYTGRGKAEVSINETSYSVDRFGIFHGGKGSKLTVEPMSDWLEYYMVLYKAEEPPFYKKKVANLLEKANPFTQQYGFSPNNPLSFEEMLKKMYERWKEATPLHLFYGKAAFYQFVYAIYEELARSSIGVLQPDVVAMMKRYIDEHYHEAVSIQAVAFILGISESHLRRSFKKQYGVSPQEYLTNRRLLSAKALLKDKSIPVRLVATASGFSDEFNFSRLFVKKIGMSPCAYRAKVSIQLSDYIMDSSSMFSYNSEGLVKPPKLNGEGEYSMFLKMKNKAIVAAAVSMMMLFSACSTPSTNPTTATPAQSITEETTSVEKSTRIVNTIKGEVEVPAEPSRVVVAFFQGDLLAMDITPVGTSFNDDAVFQEQLSDATVIDVFSLNPEDVMGLEPDLIIWNNPDDYETLSKIAPTVVDNYYSMEFEERLRFFGEVFGRSEKAEQIIQDFENKVSHSKELLAEADLMDKTVILLEDRSNGMLRSFGNRYGRGGELIYNYLGLPAPERIQKEVIEAEDVNFIDISYETLGEYSSDYIFSDENIKNMSGNAVWESLPAVKEGRLIQTRSGMFWFSDITSMNAQLDFIVESLLKTVQGN